MFSAFFLKSNQNYSFPIDLATNGNPFDRETEQRRNKTFPDMQMRCVTHQDKIPGSDIYIEHMYIYIYIYIYMYIYSKSAEPDIPRNP